MSAGDRPWEANGFGGSLGGRASGWLWRVPSSEGIGGIGGGAPSDREGNAG